MSERFQDAEDARIEGRKSALVANCTPRWWSHIEAFDAAFHIATRLEALLWGVEDDETLEECQQAAEVWMRDLRQIKEDRDRG